MAIPFFSVDMSDGEWPAYIKGLINHWGWFGEPSSKLGDYLQNRFPEHYVALFPSARLAYYLLLRSSFRPVDEIILSAMSFPLYGKIAAQLGLKPVLVDVEEEHLTIDPDKLRSMVTAKTKAIVVTHLFGHPARMDELTKVATEYEIPIIEDCAQSFDSSFQNQETGTFGWAGIVSCSLMKVPTTLGGGIFLTRDQNVVSKVKSLYRELNHSTMPVKAVSYHMKGLVSILNSYPTLYTLFSHQVLGLIKKRNPTLLRNILYSGMGMNDRQFDPDERPLLAEYQREVGAVQFARTEDMTIARRRNSAIVDKALDSHRGATVLTQSEDAYWNYQYHVVDLGARMNDVFNYMFKRGIHVMKEDVWDCTAYNIRGLGANQCPIASQRNCGLLRIPNNSFISEKTMIKVANVLLEALK